MNITAIYKRTVNGVGLFHTIVSGELYADGALPERIYDMPVIWRNSTANSADCSGTVDISESEPCLDCDEQGRYPSGAICKSCGGVRRVQKGSNGGVIAY